MELSVKSDQCLLLWHVPLAYRSTKCKPRGEEGSSTVVKNACYYAGRDFRMQLRLVKVFEPRLKKSLHMKSKAAKECYSIFRIMFLNFTRTLYYVP